MQRLGAGYQVRWCHAGDDPGHYRIEWRTTNPDDRQANSRRVYADEYSEENTGVRGYEFPIALPLDQSWEFRVFAVWGPDPDDELPSPEGWTPGGQQPTRIGAMYSFRRLVNELLAYEGFGWYLERVPADPPATDYCYNPVWVPATFTDDPSDFRLIGRYELPVRRNMDYGTEVAEPAADIAAMRGNEGNFPTAWTPRAQPVYLQRAAVDNEIRGEADRSILVPLHSGDEDLVVAYQRTGGEENIGGLNNRSAGRFVEMSWQVCARSHEIVSAFDYALRDRLAGRRRAFFTSGSITGPEDNVLIDAGNDLLYTVTRSATLRDADW